LQLQFEPSTADFADSLKNFVTEKLEMEMIICKQKEQKDDDVVFKLAPHDILDVQVEVNLEIMNLLRNVILI
jgi:hypothetical protein